MENYFIIACPIPMPAVLALDTITDDDIEKMETILLGMELAINRKNYELYHNEQLEVHNVYLSKCGNNSLVEFSPFGKIICPHCGSVRKK